MSTKSQCACRFSLRLLVGDGWAYLWTLTTADEVDLPELSRRWRRLIWNGFTPCVRVFERHPGGHGFHVHFVTRDRIDVNELRQRTESAGFGRIHVKRIPGARAEYVAKYLTKQRGGSPGIRMWSCVNFAGVPVGRIKTSLRKRYVAHPGDAQFAKIDRSFTEHVWCVGGQEYGRNRIRTIVPGAAENVRTYDLSEVQMADLRAEVEKGRPVGLGAYRGMRVCMRRVEDQRSGLHQDSAKVEHLVATGTRVQRVTEWLKNPAEAKNILPPCPWDTVVKVLAQKVGYSRGQSYWDGKVLPLGLCAESLNLEGGAA